MQPASTTSSAMPAPGPRRANDVLSLSRLCIVVAAVSAIGFTPSARACSVCGCGDPLLTANDPAAIAGKFRLQLDTDYLRIDAGTDGAPGYTDQLTQWSYRFNAVYRPIDALSLVATVPLVSKSIDTVGFGTSVLGSGLTGLGDVEVGARYSVWTSVDFGARRVHELAVSFGSAIPTGAHNATAPDGTLIDPHGQLGTGAWGPFAGIHYRLEQGDWTGYASFAYRLRTEATYFDGSKYKFGDALLWSVHNQYLVHRRVAFDLGVDGRFAWADRATASNGTVTNAVDGTGGTVLSVAPGIYLNAFGDVWLFVRGQVPFYKNLYGQQDVYPTFTTGLQFQAL